ILHGTAAGAPAELLRRVEDGRGGGDRRSGRRGGGARGRGGRSGGRSRSRLRGAADEGRAEDHGAEDGGAADAARGALGVTGGQLGAAGEAVRVVLSHDVRSFLPGPAGAGVYCRL